MRNYDPLRQRVYDIEENVYTKRYDSPISSVFDEYEVENFIDYIKSSPYFENSGGSQNLTYSISYDGRRTTNYYRHNDMHITLVPWGMNPVIICHEIAHHLTQQIAPDLPGHGTTFMSIYINLCFLASISLGIDMLNESKKSGFPLREDLNKVNEIIHYNQNNPGRFIHEHL